MTKSRPHAARRMNLTLTITIVTLLAGACAPATGPASASSAQGSTAPSPTAESSGSVVPEFVVKDGEPWIVYQWVADDGNGLYLMLPEGTDGHRILADLPAWVVHPDWSPDGNRIAFELGQDHGEIWVTKRDGSEAKNLVRCPAITCNLLGSPAWSPDGTELAYVREDPPEVAGPGFGAYVEVRNLLTGETRTVAKPVPVGDEYFESGAPRWSPDGKRLVVTVTHYTDPPTDPLLGSSIAVVDADGSDASQPRILTDPGLFGAYPDWSPDGQRIVFTTYDLAAFQEATEAANLYVIKPDGTGLTQITPFHESDTRATQPTWTPDGRQIVFTWVGYDASRKNAFGERHAAFIDPDGSNLRVLDGQYATHPRLRPTP